MSLILSIESSAELCSVALHRSGILISIKESSEPNIHGKILGKFIKEILEQNKISVSNLSAISVSSGPGSYTGLRIGVSLAKGICFASSLPLISVNTLHSLAFNIKEKRGNLPDNAIIMPMIDARRMEVYTEMFDTNLNSILKTFPLILDNNLSNMLNSENLYFTGGNGSAKIINKEIHQNLEIIDDINFSADIIGKLAIIKFEKKQFENIADFEPLYLKQFAEILKN